MRPPSAGKAGRPAGDRARPCARTPPRRADGRHQAARAGTPAAGAWTPRKLETAMPGGAGPRQPPLGNLVEQGGRALWPEVDQAGQQHAAVEKRLHGQRLRSSSTSAATSTAGRPPAGAMGRATSRRPTLSQPGPRRDAFEPDAQLVDRHLQLGSRRQPRPVPDRRRDDHPAFLVDEEDRVELRRLHRRAGHVVPEEELLPRLVQERPAPSSDSELPEAAGRRSLTPAEKRQWTAAKR
jgi:hypothetical protein